ncbi:hypothetical protein [Sphingobium sp. KCTC 72723]|uniref:hypothetical protein n=1 Tax=Sphingobium sp. KCTC 72723 TaxID=2733867 RepID=UPI00165DE663|nr:hypothetical protein [Sphingobium sp. KCTC 72723]
MTEEGRALMVRLQEAMLAHRHILATLVAEVALLTPDPDGFLLRLKNDDEDLAIASLADPKISQGMNRQVFEGRDRELQDVFEQSRLMLKLKKLLRA